MYSIRIQYVGPVPGSVNLTQREWNALVRETWRQIGLYWVAQYRAKHFSRQAYSEYQYAPRQGESGNPDPKGFKRSYTGQKLRRFGHTNPMVYSGRSEQRSRSARVHAVATRNRSGVDVIMSVPALNFRRPGSPIDMPAEMKRFSAREVVELVRLHRRLMEAKLRDLRSKTVTV